MSARTPFIPSGRPISRAAHLQQSQATNPQANSQFSADLTNPLHNPHSLAKPPTEASQSAKSNVGNNTNANTSRPLNLGMLGKRKNTAPHIQNQNQDASRRPENTIMRPGTADPSSRARQEQNNQNFISARNQSLNIAAPVPRPPPSPVLSTSLATGVFVPPNAQPMFRLPALPAPAPSDSQQLENDTHIATSVEGFSFAKSRPALERQLLPERQLPSPPNSVRATGMRTFGSGDMPDMPLLPFKINMSLGNQTGPQRVVLNGDGSTPSADGEQPLKKANTGTKRSRPESDGRIDEGDFGNNVKRYRSREDVYIQRTMDMTPRPTSPSALSVHSRTRSETRTPEDDPRAHRRQQQQQTFTPPDHEQHQYQRQHPSQDIYPLQHDMNDGLGALDKLLGCSVDAYVEDHADRYERAMGRWRICSMAEWVAGADEQAARYAKILDFVKDHMTTKMKLFASFDAKVDNHNVVLEQRAKTLVEVKERFVNKSTNVLDPN